MSYSLLSVLVAVISISYVCAQATPGPSGYGTNPNAFDPITGYGPAFVLAYGNSALITDGVKIYTGPINCGNSNQYWFTNGTYIYSWGQYNGQAVVLDVLNKKTAPGSEVGVWTTNGGTNQWWTINVPNGYITSYPTGMYFQPINESDGGNFGISTGAFAFQFLDPEACATASPAPATASPAPAATASPAPVATASPAPATASPAPAATASPAPATASPAPATASPAPATASPAPATASPAPATASPAPVATASPAPVATATPVPTSTSAPGTCPAVATPTPTPTCSSGTASTCSSGTPTSISTLTTIVTTTITSIITTPTITTTVTSTPTSTTTTTVI